MDACETFGNQRVMFSREQLDNMRAFLVHTLFNLKLIFLTHHLYISSGRCTVSSPIRA